LSATAESFAVIDAAGDVYMCFINFEVQVCHWPCGGDPFVKVAPGHGVFSIITAASLSLAFDCRWIAMAC